MAESCGSKPNLKTSGSKWWIEKDGAQYFLMKEDERMGPIVGIKRSNNTGCVKVRIMYNRWVILYFV
jgi:hypothetical protein